jgi:hypothetical protein
MDQLKLSVVDMQHAWHRQHCMHGFYMMIMIMHGSVKYKWVQHKKLNLWS